MPVYKCPRCEFIVNNTNKMIVHINGNKCKPNLKLNIPITIENLEKYIIENPFICNKCTKSFTSNSNLDKHIKNNCKKNQTLVKSEIQTQAEPNTTNITQNITNKIKIVYITKKITH